jgi:cytosine/creatinine deaminase
MTQQLLINNARLLDGALVSITVLDGVISTMSRQAGNLTADGAVGVFASGTSDLGDFSDRETLTIDAAGCLLLPGLVEPHAHVDKAFSAHITGIEMGSLEDAVERFEQASLGGRFSRPERVSSAREALLRLVSAGVSVVRTHVDIGAETAVDHLAVVREAYTGLEGLLDLQTVALAYNPIIGHEGAQNRRSLEQALSAGVDLLGGVPQFASDPGRALTTLLDIAHDAQLPVDLHLDESLDPGSFLLPELCRAVMRRGFSQPVSASHCVSLGTQSRTVQEQTARLVAEAGIGIVVLPQTNLYLQARNQSVNPPRGLAPVQVLLDHGVTVAAGGDNTRDPFNPIGKLDPLEAAALCVYAAHQSPTEALALVSGAAARLVSRTDGLTVGDRCRLVLFDASSPEDLLSRSAVSRVVIRDGRIIARTVVRDERKNLSDA